MIKIKKLLEDFIYYLPDIGYYAILATLSGIVGNILWNMLEKFMMVVMNL